jgi:hypothetical protein
MATHPSEQQPTEPLVILLTTERLAALAGAAAKNGLSIEQYVLRAFVAKLPHYEAQEESASAL